MAEDSQTIQKLSDSLIDEVVGSVGLPKTHFTHWLGWRLFRKITDRFANIGTTFENIVESDGLPKASDYCLSLFCKDLKVSGVQNIPLSGPLLVATNHPGAYDGLTVFSNLPRNDIKWISTEIPFFRLLPHLESHMLFASRVDSRNRMVVLRNAIQHLKNGGVLVYFAAGHRDPDPDVYHGALKSMDGWLDIYDVFFKYVPDLTVLPVVISGVVGQHWAKHWLPRIRRKQIDQQRLSEFGQVISQLLHPGKYYLSPSVSFGKPLSKVQLTSANETTLQMVISEAKVLLRQHVEAFGGIAD
jgi:1-acyl-sn-glycerol-3-phosphate acyltransferase